jgi:hypothetical protein
VAIAVDEVAEVPEQAAPSAFGIERGMESAGLEPRKEVCEDGIRADLGGHGLEGAVRIPALARAAPPPPSPGPRLT